MNDDRAGVQKLVGKFERKFELLRKSINEYNERKKYEEKLVKSGKVLIAGIDEVGRGPLAGPVYSAAVILDLTVDILGIRDSKKLSSSQREQLSAQIKQKAIAYSIGIASVEEIDELNIFNATKLAMIRAVEMLRVRPEHLLIDAVRLRDMDIPQTSIIKGDDLSISIGAASIVAKVERDAMMNEMAKIYPQYCFEKNKGYGTKEHIEAIKRYGACELHRRSFIKNFI
jgi:ribonuclease HII